MPITLTPAFPGNLFGPGVGFGVRSDLVGPVPSFTQWSVQTFVQNDFLASSEIANQTKGNVQQPLFDNSVYLTDQNGWQAGVAGSVIAEAQPVYVQVALQSQGNDLDTPLRTQLTWTTGNVGQQNLLLQSSTTQGGFTATDRQNLNDVTEATALPISLDTFTTSSLPIDPNTGFGSAFLPTGIWGVIVRMTVISDEFPPITPDDDYRGATLCVVRIFRGSDLWQRVPVHTTNRIISLWDQNVVTAVTQATATSWLLNMSIQVQFKPGCLGTVSFMHFP